MSDTPRLTRRQLRELGKLEARPADDTSMTAEIRLRRPTRKELREQEEMQRKERERAAAQAAGLDDAAAELETQEYDALQDADQAGREVNRGGAASARASVPERTSVFSRFDTDGDEPDQLPLRTGTSAAEAASVGPATGELAAAQSTAQDHAVEATPQDLAAQPAAAQMAETEDFDEGADDQTLRDRFLEMTKQREPETGTGTLAPVSAAPAAEANTASESAEAAESEESEDVPVEVEASKNTWLTWILLLLVAAIVGYLGGSWINMTFFSAPAQVDVGVVTNLIV